MTLKLTRQEQKVIEKLLIERPSRRKANKTLLKLVGQGFGALAANHIIIYNQKDFADIAKVIDKLNISDDLNAPSQLNAASNRLEVAKYRADEKWSQATVFAQQILIVGMDCPIPFGGGGILRFQAALVFKIRCAWRMLTYAQANGFASPLWCWAGAVEPSATL